MGTGTTQAATLQLKEEEIARWGAVTMTGIEHEWRFMQEVIVSYSLKEAVDDGVLVGVLPHRWKELTNGKPLIATAAITDQLSVAAIMEIWNDYVIWRREKAPTLPEEDQMFSTKMNDKTVWVIEDGGSFTVMYPEDY